MKQGFIFMLLMQINTFLVLMCAHSWPPSNKEEEFLLNNKVLWRVTFKEPISERILTETIFIENADYRPIYQRLMQLRAMHAVIICGHLERVAIAHTSS